MKNHTFNEQVIDQANSWLRENEDWDGYICDLHHEIYNTDYFIIGTYKATKFLESVGTFEAINRVKEYEQDNFGQCSTDLSDPEKVVNMWAYIEGEEVLQACEAITDNWDGRMTKEIANQIIEQLESL